MSIENPFRTSANQEKGGSAKEKFVSALDTVLEQMQAQGVISAEQVADKRQAAQLIEEGFSENPQHDAEVFAHAGISDEKTLIGLFEKNQGNP